MHTIEIDGVISTATKQLHLAPPFEAGDVQISIGGNAWVNTTNLPTIKKDGAPILELVLTSLERDPNAIVRLTDQNGAAWLPLYLNKLVPPSILPADINVSVASTSIDVTINPY